jgi:tRNA(Ile)-lysidine synthase
MARPDGARSVSRRAASDEVMALRAAVDRSLEDVAAGQTVMVACSGGPDSTALAGAAAWVAARRGLVVVAVVVDHGLQADSDVVAAAAAATCGRLGTSRAQVRRVEVGSDGGPEAAARTARYAALREAATEAGAGVVLLGHTRDDQAETVLLRLARGSGARALSAMAPESGLWRRPFLGLPRSVVHAAAAHLLEPLGESSWADPHNADREFARVRVRALLEGLVADLGPGVVLGLSRSADLLRDDADALDGWADAVADELVVDDAGELSADCGALADLPAAVRTRVLRAMCLRCDCPAQDVGYDLVQRLDDLIVDWHGQGEVSLPGGVVAERTYGRLCLRST